MIYLQAIAKKLVRHFFDHYKPSKLMMRRFPVGYRCKIATVHNVGMVAFPSIFDMKHDENLHPSATIGIQYQDTHTLPSTKYFLEGVFRQNSPIFL